MTQNFVTNIVASYFLWSITFQLPLLWVPQEKKPQKVLGS